LLTKLTLKLKESYAKHKSNKIKINSKEKGAKNELTLSEILIGQSYRVYFQEFNGRL